MTLLAIGRVNFSQDAWELRVLAGNVSAAADRYAAAARLLDTRTGRLADEWHGAAADAACLALVDLERRALQASDAHGEAAQVLLACAARLDDAAATWQQAQRSELPEQAQRLTWQAEAEAHEAVSRAAAQLRALAERAPVGGPSRLTAGEQVAGFGRGAVDAVWESVVMAAGLSLPRMLVDRDGWLEQVRGLRDGAAYAAGHPREAAAAAVGWDQLQDGRYGEWAGSFVPDLLGTVVSGGALPVARRGVDLADDLAELGDDVDDLQRVARRAGDSNAGGPVQRRPDADLPDDYVTVVRDLTPERRTHILDGDGEGKGGGHRSGTGKRGKSEFPADWSDDDIIRRVMETARSPQAGHWNSDHNTFNVIREFDGVVIVVSVTREGLVKTAFPQPGGRGVVRNP